MIHKKVCLLGAFAVGKSSLAERFTQSIFSEQYHTTIGVRIHKKVLQVDGHSLTIILWDLAGEDELVEVRFANLRGASGYILVVDGTRPETLAAAVRMQKGAEKVVGAAPFILAVNKIDLASQYAIDEEALSEMTHRGWSVVQTSAKMGLGVERMFLSLGQKMLSEPHA